MCLLMIATCHYLHDKPREVKMKINAIKNKLSENIMFYLQHHSPKAVAIYVILYDSMLFLFYTSYKY